MFSRWGRTKPHHKSSNINIKANSFKLPYFDGGNKGPLSIFMFEGPLLNLKGNWNVKYTIFEEEFFSINIYLLAFSIGIFTFSLLFPNLSTTYFAACVSTCLNDIHSERRKETICRSTICWTCTCYLNGVNLSIYNILCQTVIFSLKGITQHGWI